MSAPSTEYAYPDAEVGFHHAYILPVLLDFLRQQGARTVLDVGCGNGSLTRALSAAGFAVAGCDTSTTGIAAAQSADPAGEYRVVGVGEDPATAFGGRKFDAVIAIEVIEHLSSPGGLARFARPMLAPEGRLILSTPFHGYWKNLAIALLGKWDQHHISFWDCGHVKFFSRATLRMVLDAEGFSEERFAGAGRLPHFWKSMVVSFRARPEA